MYVQGYPVYNDRIGTMRPILMKEYFIFLKYYPLLTNSDKKMKGVLFNVLRKNMDNENELRKMLLELKKTDYVELVHNDFMGLRSNYNELFDFILIDYHKDDLLKIMLTDDIWLENRITLRIFNGLSIEDVSGDSEIARFQMLKKTMAKKQSGNINFESIFTSIMTHMGYTRDQVNNMTMHNFYAVLFRMSKFRSYNTTTLFKTVDTTGDIKIESWGEPQNHRHDGKKTMSKEELKNSKSEIL